MGEEKVYGEAIARLLKPFFEALKDRNANSASHTAGQLTFWRDGMLGDLQKIASGNYDEKTVASLKQRYENSESRVTEAMEQLVELRGKLAPSSIAQQIDLILHHDSFGKGSIRDGIWILLMDFEEGLPSTASDTSQYAQNLCRQIETLNSQLQRLGRMVEESKKGGLQ